MRIGGVVAAVSLASILTGCPTPAVYYADGGTQQVARPVTAELLVKLAKPGQEPYPGAIVIVQIVASSGAIRERR